MSDVTAGGRELRIAAALTAGVVPQVYLEPAKIQAQNGSMTLVEALIGLGYEPPEDERDRMLAEAEAANARLRRALEAAEQALADETDMDQALAQVRAALGGARSQAAYLLDQMLHLVKDLVFAWTVESAKMTGDRASAEIHQEIRPYVQGLGTFLDDFDGTGIKLALPALLDEHGYARELRVHVQLTPEQVAAAEAKYATKIASHYYENPTTDDLISLLVVNQRNEKLRQRVRQVVVPGTEELAHRIAGDWDDAPEYLRATSRGLARNIRRFLGVTP